MCDRKSQHSEPANSMVHGKPSKGRCGQPCMFEILSWPDPEPDFHHKVCDESSRIPADHQQPSVSHPAEAKVLQVPQNFQHCCMKTEESKQEDPVVQYDCQRDEEGNWMKKKTLKPHEIQDHLYMCEDIHLRPSNCFQAKKSPKAGQRLKSRPSPKKLNEDDAQDREIIERRKQKIKQFSRLTRDLPNSAFTTYYGKPAFQAYGRCNSHHSMKTHNIMPHRGENHPKEDQTYTGALINAKKIKNESYLPRKPITSLLIKEKTQTEASEPINLPLEKPDLINHVRFSDPESQNDKKSTVPSRSQRKQINKKYTMTPKTKKQHKKHKNKLTMNDGLKYMNTRENLLSLLEAKKMKDGRLAYKVTECYPEGWPHTEEYGLTKKEETKVAGKRYSRSDSAKHLIYRL